MPGVMVLIVDHAALFVPVRGKHIQCSLQVMAHQSRLKFQRGQRRHAAGGKTGDRAVPDILLPGCYWYGEDIAAIAKRLDCGESRVKSALFRTRKALRAFLEKEGIVV